MEKKLLIKQAEALQQQVLKITSDLNDFKTTLESYSEEDSNSSFIDKYHWFPKVNMLYVLFLSGSFRCYRDFTEKDFDEFNRVLEEYNSVGKAYNVVVKNQFTPEIINPYRVPDCNNYKIS